MTRQSRLSVLFRAYMLPIAPLDGVRVTRVSRDHARERAHVRVRLDLVKRGRAEYAVECRQCDEVLMRSLLLHGAAVGAFNMLHDDFDYIGHAQCGVRRRRHERRETGAMGGHGRRTREAMTDPPQPRVTAASLTTQTTTGPSPRARLVSSALSHIVHSSLSSLLAPPNDATAVTNKSGAAWAGAGGGDST
jgi:hypothetical protein